MHTFKPVLVSWYEGVKQIKERYPNLFEHYEEYLRNDGILSEMQEFHFEDGDFTVIVYNIYDDQDRYVCKWEEIVAWPGDNQHGVFVMDDRHIVAYNVDGRISMDHDNCPPEISSNIIALQLINFFLLKYLADE